jgi:hypothetical protein
MFFSFVVIAEKPKKNAKCATTKKNREREREGKQLTRTKKNAKIGRQIKSAPHVHCVVESSSIICLLESRKRPVCQQAGVVVACPKSTRQIRTHTAIHAYSTSVPR